MTRERRGARVRACLSDHSRIGWFLRPAEPSHCPTCEQSLPRLNHRQTHWWQRPSRTSPTEAQHLQRRPVSTDRSPSPSVPSSYGCDRRSGIAASEIACRGMMSTSTPAYAGSRILPYQARKAQSREIQRLAISESSGISEDHQLGLLLSATLFVC